MPINTQYSGSPPNPPAGRWTELDYPRFARSNAGASLRSRQQSGNLVEIHLSADELAHLHQLLTQELQGSRVELHRTVGVPYRDAIRHRMEQQEALLKKVDAALPAAPGTKSSA